MDLSQYSTLWDVLNQIPDPRHAKGKLYAWPLLLTLLCGALTAGQRKLSEIYDWVQWHGDEIQRVWHSPVPRLPSYATLRRALLQIDLLRLEQALEAHARGTGEAAPSPVLEAYAVDGKTLRGTVKYGPAAQTHLVSVVQHTPVRVWAQQRVDTKTNEITAVAELLGRRDLQGKVITLDALLTQKSVAQLIQAQGGHYLMVVKRNQPALWDAIELLFRQPPWLAQEAGSRRIRTQDYGHGRFERRTLEASTWLQGYLEWPGVQQVLRRTCERKELKSGKVSREVTYGITSLGPTQVSPDQLERFWRGHWTIENCVHYVRDESMGEDRCQVHSGSAAQVLAALRNGILNALRQTGWKNIAAALRHFGSSVQKAFQFIGVRAS